jgi:putative ABC transport system ATP-binding protein/lipoprotein-releasing system ATP-binding protein
MNQTDAASSAHITTETANLASLGTIQARDVRVQYKLGKNPIDVLRGISLQVHPGEKVFLCGPSGAGKTTLLYVLGGLEHPTSGEVLVDGAPIYRSSENLRGMWLTRWIQWFIDEGNRAATRNNRMGYVFQNYSLLPEFTALENVCMPALIGERDARERAKDLLNRVGLGHRIQHLPAELSGGEQQRVAIARALMNDPQFLFADEPTGNLDSKTGGEIMNILLSLVAEFRKTLMVVTHDSRLAELGDRILHLRDGMLEA